MTPTDRATTPNESAQLEQLSERMQGLAIQTSVYDKVDVTLWGQDIKPDEEDEIAVTTYAARFMSNAQFERLEGDNILDHFQQHFEGWNQDTWNRVHMDYKRALRLLLRRRGIYTGRENGPFAPQFIMLQTVEDRPAWPEREYMETDFDIGTTAHKLRAAGSKALTSPREPQSPSVATSRYDLNKQPPIKTLTKPPAQKPTAEALPTTSPPTTSALTTQDAPNLTSLTAHPTTHRFKHPELVQSAHNPPPDPPSEPMHPEAYTKLPPDDTPNAPVDADTQYMFMKCHGERKETADKASKILCNERILR
ncbi:hypothetical protein HRG_009749 [Hirsutella rhossiliensis]|uniref:Uncharacterized protein n=1 Tax=Hirsutella rhossiliensis TaxID=111463 RepID=A0A9P8MPF4_9HYPO|nr:uncharacterized protein HRG_09749 [Hirsutella rhossiliensis]KAH0959288.1 hypothetical protein HRG_09749 [Hirsutella rhossiliensis]